MKTEVNKMTKQPSYRFAGYTESWVEKKLGEVADRYDNLRVPVSANERISGSTPYYGANGIQDYVDGYTHDGEFILIAEDGASDLKDYPVQYVNGKVWVNNHAHVIRGKHNLIKNLFLLFAVKRINIEPFLVGGGRAKLNSDVMMKLPLRLPSLSEQTAIGSFFQDIDQLISLQQRKLEVLKEQKKTYLKLLFPAKGQTKPALRFAGFEDDWKEVKLGEVTDIKTGGRDVQNSVEDGLYPFYIRSEEVKRINSYSFDGEAILIPGEGRLGEIFHYANGKFDVHQRVYKISNFTDVNAKFVLQQMKKDFKQHAMRNTVKATVDSLRLPTIQSFNILVPSLPEQTAIGSFFQDLDKAIAKQEEKVNQLKESKQTFLKEMFI